MIEKKKNFLKILKIELDDIATDINLLILAAQKERQEEKISNYVFLENLALFHNEILAVNAFENIIDALDLNDFETLELLVREVKKSFNDMLEKAGFAPAVIKPVLRKVDKVYQYIES